MINIIIFSLILSISSCAYAFTEGPVRFDNMIALMYSDDSVYTSRLLHLPQYSYSVLQIKGDNKLDFNKDFELRRHFLNPRALVRLTPEYPIGVFVVGEVEAFWNRFDVTVKNRTVTKQVEWLEGRTGAAAAFRYRNADFSMNIEIDGFFYETRSNGKVKSYLTLKYSDIWLNNLFHIDFDAKKSCYEQVTLGYAITEGINIFWQGQVITDKPLVNRVGIGLVF